MTPTAEMLCNGAWWTRTWNPVVGCSPVSIYSRRANGRFQRATMENTFGLRVWVCAACHGCNPRAVDEAPPEICAHCGVPFRDADEQVADAGATP